MDANSSKGLCIALLFIDTLLFGWPPYFLIRGNNLSNKYVRIRGLVISNLTCFAGGVFLGACLLHLLAEGREQMEDYFQQVGADIDFPVYEAVTAGGFFLIAIVEQIAHRLLHNSSRSHGHSHAHHNGTAPQPGENARKKNTSSPNKPREDKTKAGEATRGMDNPAYYLGKPASAEDHGELSVKGVKAVSMTYVSGEGTVQCIRDENCQTTVEKAPEYQESTTAMPIQSINGSAMAETSTDDPEVEIELAENEKPAEHAQEMVQILEVMDVNPLRAFLLLGAMSFHTIFDGLAVGLQTKQSSVWEMFTAICIHKSLVALCLGMQLFLVFKTKPIKAFMWVFFFSLISPIGVGLGMILTSGNINVLAEELSSWILQAVATGTFLYITMFEMLHEELMNNGGVVKVIIVAIGFSGMALAKYLDAD